MIKNPDSILFCSSASGNPETPDKATEVSNIILANQTAYNVSKLLDSLLQDYDNSLRPDFAGKTLWLHHSPVHQCSGQTLCKTNCSLISGPSLLIEVNMQVRSMGPISEMDMVSAHTALWETYCDEADIHFRS